MSTQRTNQSNKSNSKSTLTKDDIMSALFELHEKSDVFSKNHIPSRSEEVSLRYKNSRDRLSHTPDQEGFEYLNKSELMTILQETPVDNLDLSSRKQSVKSSLKDIPPTKRDTPSQIEPKKKRSVSPINDIINRLYRGSPVKEHQMTALRLDKLQRELEEMKPKPEMSPGSRKLNEARQMKPIYNRSPDILRNKEEKLVKARRIKEEQEKPDSSMFNISMHTGNATRYKDNYKSRSPKELRNDLLTWYSKKQALQQAKQCEKIATESNELSFSPKLGKKTQQINMRTSTEEGVEQRLFRLQEEADRRKEALREKSKPIFKPILNQKTQKICQRNQYKRNSQEDMRFYLDTEHYNHSRSPIRNRTPF